MMIIIHRTSMSSIKVGEALLDFRGNILKGYLQSGRRAGRAGRVGSESGHAEHLTLQQFRQGGSR